METRVPEYAILEAPSNLGLWPSGVERLGDALRAAGLAAMLGAASAGRVDPPPYDGRRDPVSGLINGDAIRAYSRSLAGDCSVLPGPALALRRRGRYGLLFLDGHTDFYSPEAGPRGEVASMELALVSGRGPAVLDDLDGLSPLVRDADIVALGFRDEMGGAGGEPGDHGDVDPGLRPRAGPILGRGPGGVAGARPADTGRAGRLLDPPRCRRAGRWRDARRRLPDARRSEPRRTLHPAQAGGRVRGAVGITVAIFNPDLDPDGAIARRFVRSIALGLASPSREPD